MKILCALVLASLLLFGTTGSFAKNSKPLQARYCAGMQMEKHVPYGGRVDCLSEEYAIEVEWVKDWYDAVGQSLYYAAVTKRRPGIILLCPSSGVHAEGECRSYLYRLGAALSLVRTPVKVWECFPEDMTLVECFEPDLRPD